MHRICSVILFLLIGCTAAVTQQVTGAECGWGRSIPTQDGDGETLYRGEYCNYDYAYRVLLPTRVVAHGSMPPSPNHGFGILPAEPSATRSFDAEKEVPYLYVDASYPAWLDDPSLASLVRDHLDRHSDGMTLTGQRIVTMDGIRAIRALLTKGENVKLVVLAYRKNMNVAYTIALTTTKRRLQEDEALFEQVIRGFRLQRRPEP